MKKKPTLSSALLAATGRTPAPIPSTAVQEMLSQARPVLTSPGRVGTGAQKRHSEDTTMITTEAQLQQAIEQIQRLCRAIESLRVDIFPQNPKNFAILAEGPVDEIRK